MKHTFYKILCLNLALIAFLSLSIPTLAEVPKIPEIPDREEELELLEAPEWAYVAEKASMELTDTKDSKSHEPVAENDLLRASNGNYRIVVGNTSFSSNETRSGTGWNYEDGQLVLDGYNGSAIAASGDLVVFTHGTVNVQGSSSYAAIDVCGDLDLIVTDGSFHAAGTIGNSRGINGIYAMNTFSLYLQGGTSATIEGSNSSNGTQGGHGIWAGNLSVYGPTKPETIPLTIFGGAAPSGLAGSGIYAGAVYFDASAEIRGGCGTTGRAAILYRQTLVFGLANLTLTGGRYSSNSNAAPVEYTEGAQTPWYYHPHTTLTRSGASYFIRINKYHVRLLGGGGVRGSATYTDLVEYYPTAYRLSDYLFTRSGYTQVTWTNASGDLMPLDFSFTPRMNQHFIANWTQTNRGDILLNGLGGRLDGELMWRCYSNTSSLKLINALLYDGNQVDLLGWHTLSDVQSDDNGILSGVWYAGGSEVKSNPAEAIVLYAMSKNSAGSFIVYHSAEGTPKRGGNEIVQRSYASSTNLKLYAVDGAEYLKAPDGYRFSGWATAPGGTVQYTPRDKVPVEYGVPVHLYAVWDSLGEKYEAPECVAWVDKETKEVALKIKDEWIEQQENPEQLVGAIYDTDGKMVGLGLFPKSIFLRDGILSLKYSGDGLMLIKLFTLNAFNAPTGSFLEIDLLESKKAE